MKKPRDQFAVLLLLPGEGGRFHAVESFAKETERSCYKFARFLFATQPTGRCELHVKRGEVWAKLRDIPRVFAPGDRIHAVHIEAGMVVTDTNYIFEATPAEANPDATVLTVAMVLPPRPGVREVSRKYKVGDVVTEHWTTEFINIGSRERAEALYNEATLAWTESMKEKPAAPARHGKLALLAALLPLAENIPSPQAYRNR